MAEEKKSFIDKIKELIGKILPDKDAKRIAALTCEGCGKLIQFENSEEYAKYVTFTVVKTDYEQHGKAPSQPPEKGKYVQFSVSLQKYETVEIEYTCPECGKKTKIKYRFLSATVSRGSMESVPYVESGVYESMWRKEAEEAMAQIDSAEVTDCSIYHPNYNPKRKSNGRIAFITDKNFKRHVNRSFVIYNRTIEEAVECMFTRLDFKPKLIQK